MASVAFLNSAGLCSVVIPAPLRIAELTAGGMTERQAIDAIAEQAIADDGGNETTARQVVTTLPARELRNAWRFNAGVEVDYPAAGDIVRQHISGARTLTAQDETNISAAVTARDEAGLVTIYRQR